MTAEAETESGIRSLFQALDPEDRLAESVCGVVMVLTILLTAGWYVIGSENPARSLLLAAIGCNIAWGLIDGFLYVGYDLVARSKNARMITAIRAAPNRAAAENYLGETLDNDFYEALDPGEQQRALALVYDGLVDAPIPETKVNRDDLSAFLGAFLINFLATVPATIPFLLISDWRVALRVSNVVCLIMLFLLGFRFAGHIHANPWKIGGGLMFFGLVMVAIAVALGG